MVITLDKRWERDMRDALRMLRDTGLQVLRTDGAKSVVEGTIDAARVHDLEKLDCVEYVRTVFTYDANYPPGDPRDRDGM